MTSKIVVGPINRGFRNDRTAFVIDNDSFPTLINAYQWRGRVKRKRGTSLLGRLTYLVYTQSIGVSGASPWTINDLYSTLATPITPPDNAAIVPGSVQIFFNPVTNSGAISSYNNSTNCEVTTAAPHGLSTGNEVSIAGVTVVSGSGPNEINGGPYVISVVSATSFTINRNSLTWGTYSAGGTWSHISGSTIIFTDQGNGELTGSPDPDLNFGEINYVTGVVELTHTGGAGAPVDANFSFYPNLPVMGLEDLTLQINDYPGTLAFDTVYSYDISNNDPYDIHNTNFYKNPATGTYTSYVQKTTDTELTWNGEDYQQFGTINYQGALWATNGVTVPFSVENIGMQYNLITGMSITAATAPDGPSTVNLTITAHGLVVGDFVFINEVTYTVPNTTESINFQTGYVTAVVDPNTVTVEFPNAYLTGTYSSGGIAQYLTSRSDTTKDCIRWYDGDPANGDRGWVNFMPPLSQLSFSIADLPPAQYYLVGAKIIINFKDRLLFIGPVVQTSSVGSQKYLQDTVIYSQNGTPYYTCSFSGDPSLATTVFHEILVPDNQTATATAWWEDQTGFGGFISAGIDQPINTASSNRDVLVLGFERLQAQLVYSGNDIIPFNFYQINSELGSSSTFSTINMDRGVMTRGSRGIIIASQDGVSRIDLPIPDQVFQMNGVENGNERITAHRDFLNEWVYLTYPVNQDKDSIYKFPNQTLLYNYRDDSWAVFNETYTTYGLFRKRTGYTWNNIGKTFAAWNLWNEPWNAGSTTLLKPIVIAGNQQGFVVFRDDSTNEANSLYIKDISGSIITSPDHTLNIGDYITITGVLGTVGQYINGKIFSVGTVTEDTFVLNPTLGGSGTYVGGGLIQRMYYPFIQTKQFPVAWDMGRKTRIGPQQYLLTATENAQIQLLIFLSQNADSAYNDTFVLPSPLSTNDSLIYSTVLYTCVESANLGLTPANTNLQMISNINNAGNNASSTQKQIWHRMNTSLIGDTVQIGFSMSNEQMRLLDSTGPTYSITNVTSGTLGIIAVTVLTTTATLPVNTVIKITDVVGMTELNFTAISNNTYVVLASDATTTTIEVDSSAFTAYISGGTITPVAPVSQFAEIELHGFNLTVSPSQVLA